MPTRLSSGSPEREKLSDERNRNEPQSQARKERISNAHPSGIGASARVVDRHLSERNYGAAILVDAPSKASPERQNESADKPANQSASVELARGESKASDKSGHSHA